MQDQSIEFRDVPNFPGYRVGDDGSVWSCWRRKGRGWGRGTHFVMSHMHWRPLKQYVKYGYMQVSLRKDKKYYYLLVHRIVLEAFVSPCPPGQECRHKNGNRTDNRPDNLHWGTRRDNIHDRFAHGTMRLGEACNLSKTNEKSVREIRAKHANGARQVDLAAEYGITQSGISAIICRVTWKHVV